MSVRTHVASVATRAVHVVAVIALLFGFSGGTAGVPLAAADYAAGDVVVVATDGLNLRDGPGMDAGVIQILKTNDVMKIVSGPVASDGHDWYEVDAYVPHPTVRGWVASEFVIPIEQQDGTAENEFPDNEAVVNTDSLNVRSGPGLSYPVIRVLSWGTWILVGPSPVKADGYTWYTLEVPDKPAVGWLAGEFLADDSGGTPDGSGFVIGDRVSVATDMLNLRSAAGTGASVITVLVQGATLTVTGGPTVASGYSWYAVTTSTGINGWVAGEFLTYASGGDGGGGNVISGTMVVDTPRLNMRSAAGLSASVVLILDGGTQVTVLSGPVVEDGYHWYQVKTSSGTTGWMIGEGLAPVLSEPFSIDDAVRVTGGTLNLRANPGLEAPVLRVLADNEVLLVTDGPVTRDGYDWYKVRNDGGVGWAAGEYLVYEPNGFPDEDGGS